MKTFVVLLSLWGNNWAIDTGLTAADCEARKAEVLSRGVTMEDGNTIVVLNPKTLTCEKG
jgi:hypothetical protein